MSAVETEKPARGDVAAWGAAFAAYCAVAWPDFYRASGDALIHFVYALNAASGRWFQFNAGELSAGSTSVFYTTALVPIVRLLGFRAGLYAVCTACILAVALLLWIVCRATRRLTGSAAWAACAGVVVATNPGLAYNSPQGIEAPFFALAVAALLLRDPQWAAQRALGRSAFVAAALAALVVALRPEGTIVLGATLLTLAAARQPDGRRTGVTPPLVLVAAAGGASLVLLGLWQWRWTGVFLPASAASRLMMARREGLHLGGLWIYPRFLTRLAAYAPLAAGPFVAAWLMRGDAPPARFARLSAVVLAAITILYTCVTGAAHAARYMMFLVPLMALAAVLAARQLWPSRRGRWLVVAGTVALLASYGAETVLRARWRGQSGSWTVAQIADDHDGQVAFTSDWLARTDFDAAKCGTMRLSSQEVQSILHFDPRVQLVSTDGRVWPVGVKGLFRADGSVDAARWIATLKPNVLLEMPQGSELSYAIVACQKSGAATCPFAGIDWTLRPRSNAWVDPRCLR